MKQRVIITMIVAAGAFLPGFAGAAGFIDFWLTPDQQGQRLSTQGQHLQAAEVYRDSNRRASAYFRGGDFESAAALWGRLPGAEAAYNRGTALIMLGRYDAAIESLESALEVRPGWAQAEQNLAIARVRKQRLEPAGDDAGGTGGKLGADEIVFDESGRVNQSGTEVTSDEESEELSDEAMRAVWLRRAQGSPSDFLRARFSWQIYQSEQEAAGADD